MSSLNGSHGFVLNGIDPRDLSGGSLSHAGDVNGDGVDDLIIDAYSADPNGLGWGESYVVFGQLASNIAEATVTIDGVNNAPMAADDTASTNEDTPVTIDVFANDFDVDGGDLTVTTAFGVTGDVTHQCG